MSDVPIFYNLQTAGDVTAITGRLSDLETTVNTNLVAAINEIDGKFPVSIANGGTGGTTATEARTNLGVMTGVSLYYNDPGTTGTIDLSQSIENFQMIELFFWLTSVSTTYNSSFKIHSGGINSFNFTTSMVVPSYYNGTPRLNEYAFSGSVSGTELTRYRNQQGKFTGTNQSSVEDTTTTASIYAVIGYKY